MATPAHDVPAILLGQHPEWLAPLLAMLGCAAPIGPLAVDDSTLRGPDGAEVRPDRVFSASGGPAMLEVQLAIDPAKAWRWPLAWAIAFAARQGAPNLIVLTTSRAVARWARTVATVRTAEGTSAQLRPIVAEITRAHVPLLLDGVHPELAFFAAWFVRNQTGPDAVETVRRALFRSTELPEAERRPQAVAILSVLSRALLRNLTQEDPTMSMFPEGPALREWRESLEAKGMARGLAQGKAEAIFAFLAARGVALDEVDRERIATCTDLATLDRWILRAASATDARGLFEPPER